MWRGDYRHDGIQHNATKPINKKCDIRHKRHSASSFDLLTAVMLNVVIQSVVIPTVLAPEKVPPNVKNSYF